MVAGHSWASASRCEHAVAMPQSAFCTDLTSLITGQTPPESSTAMLKRALSCVFAIVRCRSHYLLVSLLHRYLFLLFKVVELHPIRQLAPSFSSRWSAHRTEAGQVSECPRAKRLTSLLSKLVLSARYCRVSSLLSSRACNSNGLELRAAAAVELELSAYC